MKHHEHHHDHDAAEATATFPTDTAGLPQAAPTKVVDLADGDTFELRIAPVAKRIGDDTVRMIAYNGSVPGPTLRVRQGSELLVDVVNEGDLDAARALVESAEHAELFLYPGDQHYFADSSVPSYDADAAALLTRRVLDFLRDR